MALGAGQQMAGVTWFTVSWTVAVAVV